MDTIKSQMTARELLELNIKEIPMLVEGLIQQTGLVGLIGSSDVAKSTFLRQLSISIARNDDEFLGFPLNTRTNKVIYVSTEDVMQDIAYLIRRQLGDPKEVDDCYENLTFITDTFNLEKNLENLLKTQKPDCVIIDCFTDIFIGDMNMASSIRPFLNSFKELSQKYKSLFIMLNHVGKGKENRAPSKNNSLGSQSFEAKLRMVAELRRDNNEDSIRHFCIVKGNYLSDKDKSKSYILNFDDKRLWFTNSGKRKPFNELTGASTLQDDWLDRCLYLKSEDTSRTIDDVHKLLSEEGFDGSRSTVGKWIKDNKG